MGSLSEEDRERTFRPTDVSLQWRELDKARREGVQVGLGHENEGITLVLL